MAKVNLHIASLVGPGETPAERTTLTVAPAYAFVDGTAINWPVVASGGALAALLSLATSIGNASFTAGDATPGDHV